MKVQLKKKRGSKGYNDHFRNWRRSLKAFQAAVHNREEIKRLNGLSVFVGDVEQRVQNKECTEKIDKLKKLGAPSQCNSDYKSWAKSIWSSTKRKNIRKGPIFSKKGEKIVFKFHHFVKPEQIIKEYIQVNIYNKPRLVKIDKKESSKSSLNDNQIAAEVDLHSRKSKESSKCGKSRTYLNAGERKISGWRLNKSTESTKKSKNVSKRISATHNFVYEFDPLANSASTSNNAIKRRSQRVSNIGGGDSPLRSMSKKQNVNNVQESVAAALPKLNLRSDTMMDNLGKQKNMINCNKNTNLPRIKRSEVVANQRLIKDRGKPSPVSEIDREVEKVKSDWQLMRTSSEWMQSKHLTNARTRMLYDTLEKMTREIDKIQTSYLDPKSNQYLQRGAIKALHAPCVSFEEKAGEIKNILFPKENKKTVNETNNVLRNTVLSKTSKKEVYTSKELESRSLLPQNLKSSTKANLSNFNKQNININNRKSLKKMGGNVQQYLENYISDAEKNFVNKEETNITEFNTSPTDVEEMLKKLNIHSFDMYDIADCYDEDKLDSPLQSIQGKKNTGTSARTAVNEKIEKLTATGKIALRNSSSKKEDYLMTYNNALNADTSIQTNGKFNCKNNAFIEMGLSTLSSNLPHDALSRILQSEYLKKDMSLKPM